MRARTHLRCYQHNVMARNPLPSFIPGQFLALFHDYSRSVHAETPPWGGRALVLDGRFHAEQWKREISAKIALRKETLCTVSYTHLTLQTIYSV